MERPQDRLELDSRLSELTRVQRWIEAIADWHRVPEEIRFAIQLCIEEALANVVLHGYRNEPGHPIVIRCIESGSELFLVIDDQAPPFAPVAPGRSSDEMQPASLESITPGGNGIRLMYHFAGSVAYEQLADGNRLTFTFRISDDDHSKAFHSDSQPAQKER